MASMNKPIDASYLLTQLKNFESQIIEKKYNLIFQFETMPEASNNNNGKIYQYIGETNGSFTTGNFYKVVSDDSTGGFKYESIIQKAEIPEYTLVKDETPAENAAATYHLQKNGANIGASIDIPKDFFLTDASTGVVTSVDKEVGGKFENNDNFAIDDAYIELDVNIINGDETSVKPVYINVSSLVDTYTAGNGIEIIDNEISIKVDPEGPLTVSATGINLAIGDGLKLNDSKNLVIDFETTNIDFNTEWDF